MSLHHAYVSNIFPHTIAFVPLIIISFLILKCCSWKFTRHTFPHNAFIRDEQFEEKIELQNLCWCFFTIIVQKIWAFIVPILPWLYSYDNKKKINVFLALAVIIESVMHIQVWTINMYIINMYMFWKKLFSKWQQGDRVYNCCLVRKRETLGLI